MSDQALLKSTLQWCLDNGVDEILTDEPVDRTVAPDLKAMIAEAKPQASEQKKVQSTISAVPEGNVIGAAEAIKQAQALAESCTTLEALEKAIKDFQGLSIKKTALNMVFADGNEKAPIMVIGEAPNTDEDKAGKPFQGESGKLLDRILAAIGLDRQESDIKKSVYITNLLNWRPPGNRTPSQAEIDISLPFLKRHIALIQPKIIICFGSLAGKALLDKNESISKLRGQFYEYEGIPLMTTYHPAYLLTTPAQKKAVWQDILMVNDKRDDLDLK